MNHHRPSLAISPPMVATFSTPQARRRHTSSQPWPPDGNYFEAPVRTNSVRRELLRDQFYQAQMSECRLPNGGTPPSDDYPRHTRQYSDDAELSSQLSMPLLQSRDSWSNMAGETAESGSIARSSLSPSSWFYSSDEDEPDFSSTESAQRYSVDAVSSYMASDEDETASASHYQKPTRYTRFSAPGEVSRSMPDIVRMQQMQTVLTPSESFISSRGSLTESVDQPDETSESERPRHLPAVDSVAAVSQPSTRLLPSRRLLLNQQMAPHIVQQQLFNDRQHMQTMQFNEFTNTNTLANGAAMMNGSLPTMLNGQLGMFNQQQTMQQQAQLEQQQRQQQIVAQQQLVAQQQQQLEAVQQQQQQLAQQRQQLAAQQQQQLAAQQQQQQLAAQQQQQQLAAQQQQLVAQQQIAAQQLAAQQQQLANMQLINNPQQAMVPGIAGQQLANGSSAPMMLVNGQHIAQPMVGGPAGVVMLQAMEQRQQQQRLLPQPPAQTELARKNVEQKLMENIAAAHGVPSTSASKTSKQLPKVTSTTTGTTSPSTTAQNATAGTPTGGKEKKRRPSLGKIGTIIGIKKDVEEEQKKPVVRSTEVGVVHDHLKHRDPNSPIPTTSAVNGINPLTMPVRPINPNSFDGTPENTGDLGVYVEDLGPGQVVGRQVLGAACLGEIQLSLFDRKGRLEIEVIRARNLICKSGAKTLPSTYVKIYLMEGKHCAEKQKTTPMKASLDPFYHQQLRFLEPYGGGRCLQVTVWGDYGRMDRKVFMGAAQIMLRRLSLANIVVGWYRLYHSGSLAGHFETEPTTGTSSTGTTTTVTTTTATAGALPR